jgi:hypothetical protein
MSAQVTAVTSETRGPLVTMTSISRWSRRPVQVLRSGLASSASTSASLKWQTTVWLAFFGRTASTRAIDEACSGWRSAAWRNSEWIAASRRLRVWAVLCRVCSSAARKPVTISASRSATSRSLGRMPVRS